MKKIFIALAIVATLMFASCNFSGNQPSTDPEQAQTEMVVNDWIQVDSLTMHYNLNDSTCLSMSLEDETMCFEGNGITSFEVFQRVDSVVYSIPVEQYDSTTWRLQLDTLKADYVKHLMFTVNYLQSIELDLDF